MHDLVDMGVFAGPRVDGHPGQPLYLQKHRTGRSSCTNPSACAYGGPQSHAPVRIGERAFTYDRNGNQTGWTSDANGTRRTLVWDEENRVASIADNGQTTRFLYDAGGTRTNKAGPHGAGGFLEIVAVLDRHGANLTANGNRAVRLAAERGHLDVVRYLHGRGADIRAHDDYAVGMAAMNGHLDVVRYLHEHGANLTAKDHRILIVAAKSGHLELVKYLHANGVDLMADDGGAMIVAAREGHLDVVRYLHEHGVSVNVRNGIALQLARPRGPQGK